MIRARLLLPPLAGVLLATAVLVAPPASSAPAGPAPATQTDWSGPCPTATPADEAGGGVEGVLEGGEVQWFTWELPPGKSYNTLDLVADGDTGLRVCVAGMDFRRDLCRSGTNPGQLPEGCGSPYRTDAWVVAMSTPSFGQPIFGPAENVRVGIFSCTTTKPPSNSTCPGSSADGPISYKLSITTLADS